MATCETCDSDLERTPSDRTFVLLAATITGVVASNLFAPQILVGPIGSSLGMTAQQAGTISSLTFLGYASGLFLLVPLADILENKRLILFTLISNIIAAFTTAAAPTPELLQLAVFVLGVSCAAIQMLIPLVASMAPSTERGRVIGEVMSGLMVGILLSRPLASLIAHAWSWRSFYGASGLATGLLTAALVWRLPRQRPTAQVGYLHLILSFWILFREERVLRVRSWTSALVTASLSAFWAVAALRLSMEPFNLSAGGIAVFALVGVAGVAVTRPAGRLSDKGRGKQILVGSHIVVILSLGLCTVAHFAQTHILALITMGVGAVALDAGVTGDNIVGRRAVNLLRADARGRMNGLFVGLFFVGSAVGAGTAAVAWSLAGWPAVCAVAALFSVAALVTDAFTTAGAD